MATPEQVSAALTAALSAEKKTEAEIASLQASLAGARSQRDQLDAANKDLAGQVVALQAQVADLTQKLSGLAGAVDQGVADLAAQVQAQAAKNDGLIDDLPVVTDPPPTQSGDDATILAEVTDHGLAAIDRKLGPVAPAGMVLPEVWERPQVPTTDVGWGKPGIALCSQGLSIATTAVPPQPNDFGSNEVNVILAKDGFRMIRLRSEEHDAGQALLAPAIPWNNQSGAIPDSYAVTQFTGDMKDKLGPAFAVARAKINRFDGGFALCGENGGPGYVGSVGTQTARAFWGESLPAGFAPLCHCLTSQGEFMLIAGYNRLTGKGQMLVYWMWAAGQLQMAANGLNFPFDFWTARPGLLNSGVIDGMKLFGAFDLPVKFPSAIDCVCSVGANSRIQGPDGNAAYLSKYENGWTDTWNLTTASGRAAFLASNGTWIASWAKACIISKAEKKLVTIDLTPLVAGVRDQYFGSQANYDQTAYADKGDLTGHPWTAFNLTDPMQFPWGVEAKPGWAPVFTRTVDLAVVPNDMLMSEHGDAEIATADADGSVRFYKWADGSADGSLHVGDNPVHLSHDRHAGIRTGGPIVTCRASRSVVILDNWGPTAKVYFTLQDTVLVDPVATVCNDEHGTQERLLTVVDFNGKALRNYRVKSPFVWMTMDGTSFGMGPDGKADVERGGSITLTDPPFAISTSNVN